ncbi:MAG: low molecular weight protein arginine phosphatase [Candidatus Omnitrophota bacterium]
MKNIKKILFVCTGNSCRSIMAEAYLNRLSSENEKSFEARSAGILGIEGASPSKEVISLLTKEGIDVSPYISKGLSLGLVNWADLILVMAPEHKLAVLDLDPAAESKVRYLGEFNPDRGVVIIPDPIGRPMTFYKTSFSIIKQSIEELIKWIKE